MPGNRNSGRKRKPNTGLSLYTGGSTGKAKPKAKQKRINCPAWLSDYAKVEWRRISGELQKMGLLTSIDVAALAGYCQAYSEMREATQTLRREGHYYDTRDGLRKRHPAVGHLAEATRIVRSFLAEFGLSPAARAKMDFSTGEETGNALLAFANAKKKLGS